MKFIYIGDYAVNLDSIKFINFCEKENKIEFCLNSNLSITFTPKVYKEIEKDITNILDKHSKNQERNGSLFKDFIIVASGTMLLHCIISQFL